MKALAIGSVLALLATGAGAQQVHPSVPKNREVLDQCLAKYAADLDDGRSDARSIAAAVNASCSPLRQRMFSEAGVSSEGAQRNIREMRDQYVDEATAVVLSVRSRLRRDPKP